MVGAIFVAFLMCNVTSLASAIREQGVDWSKYNGNSGIFGYSTDYKAITKGTVLKVVIANKDLIKIK